MADTANQPSNGEPDLASITQGHIDKLAGHIEQIRAALAAAAKRSRECRARRASPRCRFVYIRVAQAFRRLATSCFGWRSAGILILATLFGSVSFVASLSWQLGLLGTILGAAISASLLFCPSDVKVVTLAGDLRARLAVLDAESSQTVEHVRGLRSDLSAAEAKHRQWAQLLRDRQYRESRHYRRQQLLKRDWKALRSVAFENFLEEVFRELDYVVETTKITGDQGGDLIVSRGEHRIAIQVKGYFHSVSNSAVQEAYTAKGYYECEACAVITNSRFTPAARDVANRVGCVLIDEDTLRPLVMAQLDLWQLHLSQKAQSQPQQPFEN